MVNVSMSNVAMLNVVVLHGRLSRPAELRLLPSGDRLAALELSVARSGAKAESVPVVWPDPPAAVSDLEVDHLVVVVGRVRRRFFRAGGQTQSRTEVVADRVVPARHGKRARTALAEAVARLEASGVGGG